MIVEVGAAAEGMYFGVIHGLGNDGDDDDETFIYVLSILQDRVLMEESLVSLAVLLKVRFKRAFLSFFIKHKVLFFELFVNL